MRFTLADFQGRRGLIVTGSSSEVEENTMHHNTSGLGKVDLNVLLYKKAAGEFINHDFRELKWFYKVLCCWLFLFLFLIFVLKSKSYLSLVLTD